MSPSRGRLSIRTRLAVIYTGLLAAALVTFGSGVYVVLRQQLGSAFDAALLANAEHAAGAFAEDVGPDGRLEPSDRLISQLAGTGGRLLILDERGAKIADSAPAGTPDLRFTSDDFAVAQQHTHVVRDVTAGGDVLRVTTDPVVSATGVRVGYVVWADSTRAVEDVLATVAAALVGGGLIVVILALAGGLVLARRALTPVADVTDTARAISLSGDFAARVEVGESGEEIGELALAFNEMLSALEHNHQALQRFLGDASHQLRTPLTTIRANLDLARRPDLPAGEREEILADAYEEAERMGRLIADLLSLARADSGVRLEFQPVELDAVLVESVRRQRLVATHVRMGVAGVEPAVVEGDADRLHELFGILLDNAARYTPDGGSVTTGLTLDGGQASVRIEDTGIGLDAQDRERLFERLYRGQRARELRPAGTGLGLAIAHWIVDVHGGTIELTSREGGGTVATVKLPVRSS